MRTGCSVASPRRLATSTPTPRRSWQRTCSTRCRCGPQHPRAPVARDALMACWQRVRAAMPGMQAAFLCCLGACWDVCQFARSASLSVTLRVGVPFVSRANAPCSEPLGRSVAKSARIPPAHVWRWPSLPAPA